MESRGLLSLTVDGAAIVIYFNDLLNSGKGLHLRLDRSIT